MIIRRLITIPSMLILFVLCILLYLPILLICTLLSLHPSARSAPHVWSFIVGYLCFEVLGLLGLTWVYIRYRNSPEWIIRNRYVQIWWANSLMRLGKLIFSLKFEITGKEALEGSSAIVLVRHSSIGDAVLPFPTFFTPRNREGVRYVLKQELLASPALDVGAHRLTSLFVDRSGTDTPRALKEIAEMTASAPEDESVLIYPEGTRQSLTKRAELAAKHPQLIPLLDRWPDLLPPRLGGVEAMLTANPGKDIVFIAHTGFEGSANLGELLSGSWRDMTIRVHMWRIAFADIPSQHDEFIHAQWDEMQAQISALKATVN